MRTAAQIAPYPRDSLTRRLEAWLFMVAIGHIAAGLLLPVIAFTVGFDAYAELLRHAFWHGGPVPPEAAAFQRWIVALFGPTVASWGVLMLYLVRAGSRSGQTWPWSALLLALAVWAPGDIVISLMREFWLHVFIDAAALLAIGVPALILRTRRHATRPVPA